MTSLHFELSWHQKRMTFQIFCRLLNIALLTVFRKKFCDWQFLTKLATQCSIIEHRVRYSVNNCAWPPFSVTKVQDTGLPIIPSQTISIYCWDERNSGTRLEALLIIILSSSHFFNKTDLGQYIFNAIVNLRCTNRMNNYQRVLRFCNQNVSEIKKVNGKKKTFGYFLVSLILFKQLI